MTCPPYTQSALETILTLRMLVEMDFRGILIQSRGKLMLGVLDGHAVDMVYFLAHAVVPEACSACRKARNRSRSEGVPRRGFAKQ